MNLGREFPELCGRHSAAFKPELLLRTGCTCQDEQVELISDIWGSDLHPSAPHCSLEVWDCDDGVKSHMQRRSRSLTHHRYRNELMHVRAMLKNLDPQHACPELDMQNVLRQRRATLKELSRQSVQVAEQDPSYAVLKYIQSRELYVAAVASDMMSLVRFDEALKAQRAKVLAEIKKSRSQVRAQRAAGVTKRLIELGVDLRDVSSSEPFFHLARSLPKGSWAYAELELLQAAE